MSPYELLDLALNLNSRLDVHWTLFITVHLALIGGIIYVDRPLQRHEKIIAIVLYCGFALINMMMMISQNSFLESIYQQLLAIKDEDCCANNYIFAHLESLDSHKSIFKTHVSIIVTHILMFIILSLSIIYDKPINSADK